MERREAIEIVREYYPSSGKDLNEALETLIPELKESEDERIRKELIEFISWAVDRGSVTEKQREISNFWIAWLEKQGSQNLANSEKTCKVEPQFKVGDTIHEIGERHIFPMVIEKIEDGDYVCDNGSSFINIEFQDKYELVEQNPAWSEKDEYILEIITSVLQVNFEPNERFSGYEEYMNVDLINWLKSLKERYTWKPSDEQMKCLLNTERVLRAESRIAMAQKLSSLYNDLKKLTE